MERQNLSSGAKWEEVVGYSRAVRVGHTIQVAGTTATNEQGEIVGLNSPYEQTQQILRKIEAALQAVGGELRHVTRTRIFVTDISRWEEVGRAHGEVFRDIRPVCTMVEVSKLIDPQMLVEIEVDALLY